MNKVNIIGAIAVIALIVGGAAWLRAPHVADQNASFGAIPAVNAPAANTVLPNGQLLPNPTNYDYLVSRLYFYADGAQGMGDGTSVPVNQQAKRASVTSTASSTPCAVQNPFTATSTILSTSLNVTTATSTALTISVSTSTTAFATSTGFGNFAIAANQQKTIALDPGNDTGVIGPSGWVVFGAAGGPSTLGALIGGSCQAVFQTAN